MSADPSSPYKPSRAVTRRAFAYALIHLRAADSFSDPIVAKAKIDLKPAEPILIDAILGPACWLGPRGEDADIANVLAATESENSTLPPFQPLPAQTSDLAQTLVSVLDRIIANHPNVAENGHLHRAYFAQCFREWVWPRTQRTDPEGLKELQIPLPRNNPPLLVVRRWFAEDLECMLGFKFGDNLKSIDALREHGNNLVHTLAYPQALAVYSTAIAQCTSLTTASAIPQLLVNRSIAYTGLNSFAEAIQDLSRLVYICPCFLAAWTQLAFCFLHEGQAVLALRCYAAALRAVAGDILPRQLAPRLWAEYRQHMLRLVHYTYVNRIVCAFTLAQKRAVQQGHEETEIQAVAKAVVNTLAKIRAQAPEQSHSLLYLDSPAPDPPRGRVARQDPAIMTPKVQSLLQWLQSIRDLHYPETGAVESEHMSFLPQRQNDDMNVPIADAVHFLPTQNRTYRQMLPLIDPHDTSCGYNDR